MHYIAHADLAFQSVEHIMRDVNYGWLIRYACKRSTMFFFAVYSTYLELYIMVHINHSREKLFGL